MHLPTWLGALPGFSALATRMMIALTLDDFVPQVEDVISVGEFYAKAAGGQIVFT
jgi:hypothetical protein